MIFNSAMDDFLGGIWQSLPANASEAKQSLLISHNRVCRGTSCLAMTVKALLVTDILGNGRVESPVIEGLII